jgi:hypothetical protein
VPVRARVEVELMPTLSLQDAFVAWQPAPAVALFAGQFKVPYSVQSLAAETRRQLPHDAAIVAQAGFDRDLGAMAALRLPIGGRVRATLDAALMNGEGRSQLGELGTGLLFAVRGAVAPLGARDRPQEGTLREPYLGLGGGWVLRTGAGADGETTENAVGLDVQVAAGPLSFQAEYLDRAEDTAGGPKPEASARGLYGQLGSFIPAPWVQQHLEVVLRGGWSAPKLPADGSEDPAAAITLEGGVNLYAPEAPAMLHDVKVQLGFAHTLPAAGRGRPGNRLDLAGTVRF